MKTKQEQVEELATIISNSCERHGTDLREPEIDLIAIDVYSEGYRKTFTSDLASDTQKAFKEGYEKGAEEMRKEAKKTIEKFIKYRERQAVKEFAERLKKQTMCITEYDDGTRILQTSNKLIDQSVEHFLKETEQ